MRDKFTWGPRPRNDGSPDSGSLRRIAATRPSWLTVAIPSTFLLLYPVILSGQSVFSIASPSTCLECTIRVTPSTRLGSEGDAVGVAILAEAAVDTRGRFAVASPMTVGEILIYEASGRFVRTIGRRGGGPGEFEHPVKLRFGPGDSLHVLEEGIGRFTVFTPALEHARSVTLAGRAFSFALGRSGQVVAAAPSAAEGRQFGIQVFSPSGERLLAFEEVPAGENAASGAGRRHVALDREGGVWTVRPNRYEIRSYDSQGNLRRTYRGIRDWISGEPLPTRWDLTRRPPGQIGALAVDDAGLVWVFAVVPDANWRPLQPQAGPPDPSAIYDTLIEVFDPRSGALVAHARVDHLVFPLRSGQIYGIVPQPSGDQQVQIWNVTLPRTP